MTSIILFRFHSHIDVCRERILLIRHLNPSLPIHGLYGGPRAEFAEVMRRLGPLTDGMWCIESTDSRWKWLHQDIAVKEWFVRDGHRLAFDRMYDYEYDLLLAAPLSRLGVPPERGVVAFSGLRLLEDVRERWYWTSVEPFASGFRNYQRFMRERYGLQRQRHVTQGPFPVLSRAFLEALSGQEYPLDVFKYVNCEASYPGVAEAHGFEIVDTAMHPGWTASVPSIPVSRLFHCEARPPVALDDISRELADPGGRRAFHPVKHLIEANTIIRTLAGDARISRPCER